jgi:sulfatase modifying factor 1
MFIVTTNKCSKAQKTRQILESLLMASGICLISFSLVKGADLPPTKINEKDKSELVLIPAGEFTMGSNQCYYNDEKPAHKVYLNNFYIDKYEITNTQYQAFVQATKHEIPSHSSDPDYDMWSKTGFPPETAKQPVVNIGWQDADAYCKWAGKRLPTEAEWEKAARGDDGRTYPWGNKPPEEVSLDYLKRWNGVQTYKPVGSLAAVVSPFGVFDMAGNAAEWVSDWYDPNYYKQSPAQNPTGPQTGFYKVLRGGSSINASFYLRCIDRDFDDTNNRAKENGFRCVSTP